MNEPDEPDNDRTPLEHPAYRRGEDYGVDMVIREIRKIIGHVGSPKFESWQELKPILIEIWEDACRYRHL